MKKKITKKLALSKETLLPLQVLATVKGGFTETSCRCEDVHVSRTDCHG